MGNVFNFTRLTLKKPSRQTNEKPKTYKKIPVAPTKKEDVQLLPILRKKNKHTKPKKLENFFRSQNIFKPQSQ